MKKTNGFTLIELLGVLVLLAVIALISFVVVDSNLKASKQEMYKKQIETIELAARNWGSDNLLNMPTSVSLMTLKIGGYIAPDIANPVTGKCFSNNTRVYISKAEGRDSYNYKIQNEDSIKYDENCDTYDSSRPTISVDAIHEEIEFLTTTQAFLITSNTSGIDKSKIRLYSNVNSGELSTLSNLSSAEEVEDSNGNYVMYVDVSAGTVEEEIKLIVEEGAVVTAAAANEQTESGTIKVKGRAPEVELTIKSGSCNDVFVGTIKYDHVNQVPNLYAIKVKGEKLGNFNYTNNTSDLSFEGYYLNNNGEIKFSFTANEDFNEIVIEEGAFYNRYGSIDFKNEKITKFAEAPCFELYNPMIVCDNMCAVGSNTCTIEELKSGVSCKVMTHIYTDVVNQNKMAIYNKYHVLWNGSNVCGSTCYDGYVDGKIALLSDEAFNKNEEVKWGNGSYAPDVVMEFINNAYLSQAPGAPTFEPFNFKYEICPISSCQRASYNDIYVRLPLDWETSTIYNDVWLSHYTVDVGSGTVDGELGYVGANFSGGPTPNVPSGYGYQYFNDCGCATSSNSLDQNDSSVNYNNLDSCKCSVNSLRGVVLLDKGLVQYKANLDT